MNTKFSIFSELSNILSVKSSLRTNLMALFTRFGLGHRLFRMSLEKQAVIPAVQLILSLCLFRMAGESIHSITGVILWSSIHRSQLLLSDDAQSHHGLAQRSCISLSHHG